MCDFGTTKYYSETDDGFPVLTQQYAAPELLQINQR